MALRIVKHKSTKQSLDIGANFLTPRLLRKSACHMVAPWLSQSGMAAIGNQSYAQGHHRVIYHGYRHVLHHVHHHVHHHVRPLKCATSFWRQTSFFFLHFFLCLAYMKWAHAATTKQLPYITSGDSLGGDCTEAPEKRTKRVYHTSQVSELFSRSEDGAHAALAASKRRSNSSGRKLHLYNSGNIQQRILKTLKQKHQI